MRKQRLMGLVMVAISVAILALASTGKTPENRDATAVLITLPLGMYALVTKEYILYDGDAEAEEEPEQKVRVGLQAKRRSTYRRRASRTTAGAISRKELHHGTKTHYRGPGPQVLGGR